PPTGKRIRWQGLNIYRVANGQITDDWAQEDALSMMQQLGVIPGGGPPVAEAQPVTSAPPAAPRTGSTTATSPEENKALIRRVLDEAVNGHNLAIIDELYDPAYVQHTFGWGRDAEKTALQVQRATFPDGHTSM